MPNPQFRLTQKLNRTTIKCSFIAFSGLLGDVLGAIRDGRKVSGFGRGRHIKKFLIEPAWKQRWRKSFKKRCFCGDSADEQLKAISITSMTFLLIVAFIKKKKSGTICSSCLTKERALLLSDWQVRQLIFTLA